MLLNHNRGYKAHGRHKYTWERKDTPGIAYIKIYQLTDFKGAETLIKSLVKDKQVINLRYNGAII